MSEFFGIGGYQRPAEGYLSWQHLLFVSSLMVVMIACSVWFGLRLKKTEGKKKNLPLIVTAIAIDALELFKIVFLCFRNENPLDWLHNLPLFLCSIQLITIPLAAFTHGRLKEISMDFVFVFGILGAVMGTYFAGNNYSVYPVLSFDNVVSGITHSLSGFASLYIVISGQASMKWKNLPFTCLTMLVFCVLAYIANVTIPYNYMFLMRGDGTPYDILFNLVGGNPVIYPILVVVMFFVYIAAFYGVYHLVINLLQKRRSDRLVS